MSASLSVRARRLLPAGTLLLPFLVGCGGASPTVVDPVAVPPAVVWRWEGALDAEKAWGNALWPKLKECVGDTKPDPADFPIYVKADYFMCGNVEAAGCFGWTEITVARPSFRYALMVEMWHYSLWRRNINFYGKDKLGNPSDVDNPLFGRCEYLGY